jgi:hypothetical protein
MITTVPLKSRDDPSTELINQAGHTGKGDKANDISVALRWDYIQSRTQACDIGLHNHMIVVCDTAYTDTPPRYHI